jgi:transmembrane protein 222
MKLNTIKNDLLMLRSSKREPIWSSEPMFCAKVTNHMDKDGSRRESRWESSSILQIPRKPANVKVAISDVSPSRDLYPCCIVWTGLPLITMFLPFVGHMGICDSRGVIYDFAGPYSIGVDQLSFSPPTRYIRLDPSLIKSTSHTYDSGIDAANDCFETQMHNIVTNNCHDHVAKALNEMKYNGRTNYNSVNLAIWMFFYGKRVSVGRTLYTFGPFFVVLLVVMFLCLFVR